MRSANGPSKLFVGDIGNNRKSDLSRLFSKYGEISTIYIDDNKRFAFVEFTSSNDAQRALRHTNNKTVNGSRLRVEYAKSDKASRDSRRPASREHSPISTLYNHLQVTANRLPSMHTVRHSYYQCYPSTMITNSAISRGRSLTPPSLKHSARLSSTNHLRTQEFYPPYYPPYSATYPDSTYYQTYGDPYLMQRMPPPTFFPPLSSSPPLPSALSLSSSSSSHAYRNMYVSSDRHRPEPCNKRTRRSRSGRRSSTSRKTLSNRDKKVKRRSSSSSSSSSSEEQRERGPQTPPPSHKTKKRSKSGSNDNTSASEQKSTSSSSSEDETSDNKQSNSKKFQDVDSSRKHSKRRTRV